MFDAILLDLDGTLTDPKEGITKCVQYALMKMGIIEPSLDSLLNFIGPPLVDSFQKFYGMTPDEAEMALIFYRERFQTVGIKENALIDGIPELLEALKDNNKIVALATSKPHIFARQVLENFNLTQYFDIIVGAEFDGTRNMKKDVIIEVLNQLPKSIKSPIMVGDRKEDIIGAKACSLPSVGVRFGYAEENELENAGADYIVSTVDELKSLLLNS